MASKKKGLKDQVRALEALAGVRSLSDAECESVNGGATATKPIIKPLRGTGAIAVRRGTGAIAQRIGGTGAIVFRGTGAVAIRKGGF